MTKSMLNRFLDYVKIDTRSDDSVEAIPSSEGQWTLARLLVDELKELGLSDVILTNQCFVHATLPANTDKVIPVIGLMAHLDTYPGFESRDVKPLIHPNYNGGILTLNENDACHLDPKDFPDLLRYIGHDLITTDGKTLLGADDKAGIAEIMEVVTYFTSNPEIVHGEIRIAFTPDEETDRGGMSGLDLNNLPVDFVITVDGDGMGEVNFENFNAAHAIVEIKGRSVHTGEAKGKMINACMVGSEWIGGLPKGERPEYTEGHEGFFHIEEFSGNVDHARIYCLIRDFSMQNFSKRKEIIEHITSCLQLIYGEDVLTLHMEDDYYNMKQKIEERPEIIEGILHSMRDVGIEPKNMPIRGGTDGAMLAELGIAAPNIFLGGHNYHGQYEFVSLQAMEAATRVVCSVICYFAGSEAK